MVLLLLEGGDLCSFSVMVVVVMAAMEVMEVMVMVVTGMLEGRNKRRT